LSDALNKKNGLTKDNITSLQKWAAGDYSEIAKMIIEKLKYKIGEKMCLEFMLAQYLKRLAFADVYKQAEGNTPKERKDHTYSMLKMLDKVRIEVNKQ